MRAPRPSTSRSEDPKPAPALDATWIVVCDAAHARIFTTRAEAPAWTLVEAIENPRGRLKAQDLMADRPGRVQESAGLGRRSAMEPPTDPKEVEARHFAQSLATMLDRAGDQRTFGRLLLVAPPHFLGLLRPRLSERVRQVTSTVDQDHTWVDAHELPARLAAFL